MGTQLLPLVPRRSEKKVENRATLAYTLYSIHNALQLNTSYTQYSIHNTLQLNSLYTQYSMHNTLQLNIQCVYHYELMDKINMSTDVWPTLCTGRKRKLKISFFNEKESVFW